MRRALSDGAAGVPPAEPLKGAGRAAPPTQATTVLAPGKRPTPPARQERTAATVARRPRQGPPRELSPAAASGAPVSNARKGRRRLTLALLAVLVLILAVVAVVVASAPEPTKVVLRNVVYEDVGQASQALKQLVSENTK